MELEIEKIILTRDLRKKRNLPVEDDNTDVVVTLKNGSIYIASFFSYDSIGKFKQAHKIDKQFLGGKYFWAKDMVLIEDCLQESVEQVVKNLIEEGEFKQVFRGL